jgi:two-component sensor histidine kinase
LTDRAISLALIATELITNAATCAYAGQGAGTVRVVVSRQGDRHIAMRVSNDGVGLPLVSIRSNPRDLGMRIVRPFAA